MTTQTEIIDLGIERNKTRAQLIAMSHNLKTGMNIFKQMRSLGGVTPNEWERTKNREIK
jgi:hypothetical protein